LVWNKTTVFDETVLSTIFDTTVRKEYRLNQRAKIDPYRCPVVVGIVSFAADFRRFLTALVDLPPVTIDVLVLVLLSSTLGSSEE
jgi:hypothetical protein